MLKSLLILSLWALLLLSVSGVALAQEVSTDKLGYPAGATVTINGSGFHPNESVTLQVLHTDGRVNSGSDHEVFAASTNSAGSFSATWTLAANDSTGSSFRLTATGGLAGGPLPVLEATWEFKEQSLIVLNAGPSARMDGVARGTGQFGPPAPVSGGGKR